MSTYMEKSSQRDGGHGDSGMGKEGLLLRWAVIAAMIVLAAILLVTLPEFGRAFAEFRMLIFGAAMVGVMVWRPRGLIAHRAPTLRLGLQPATQ